MKVVLLFVIENFHDFHLTGPTEDYSKSVKKAAAKEEMTAKEKALATSAKGTKNIMNFFKKK